MKVFEDSLYKEQERAETFEKELTELKVKHHELEEKYADVSSSLNVVCSLDVV